MKWLEMRLKEKKNARRVIRQQNLLFHTKKKKENRNQILPVAFIIKIIYLSFHWLFLLNFHHHHSSTFDLVGSVLASDYSLFIDSRHDGNLRMVCVFVWKKKKKISSDWGGVFHFGIATAIFFGRNPKTNLWIQQQNTKTICEWMKLICTY